MMGLLDGWPFRSKEDIDRRNREFDERVIPLGPEQKDLAQAVLEELKPPRSRNDKRELLFGYLIGKDKYVLKGKGEDGMAAMTAELGKLKYLSDAEKLIIKALVKYDSDIIDIDYYPSAEKIRAAIEMNFV
jgi:hypothetical protein